MRHEFSQHVETTPVEQLSVPFTTVRTEITKKEKAAIEEHPWG